MLKWILCAAGVLSAADPERDFSGTWNLNPGLSRVDVLPIPEDKTLRIEQNGSTIRCSSEAGAWNFTTDGQPSTAKLAGATLSIVTKWEGAALMINSLGSGPRNFTLMDRWRLSRDRNTLTIRRQYLHGTAERESSLVYEREGGATAPSSPAQVEHPTVISAGRGINNGDVVVKTGTKIALVAVNGISTKQASSGDRVYLEASFPVLVDGRVVIPAGSHVTATVTQSKRAGRAKGRAELYLLFDSLILSNGTTRNLRARPGGVEGQSTERNEGAIRGEDDKAGDAAKVGEAAGAGASVGTAVGAATGHYGLGAGVGAAAGAAAGLGRVLLSRGPDVVLPKGASLELVLDRDLTFLAKELPIR